MSNKEAELNVVTIPFCAWLGEHKRRRQQKNTCKRGTAAFEAFQHPMGSSNSDSVNPLCE
eukprot:m.190991 g.190991  ORF g.190991 m.190991 type:complete len:60 (+) comp15140_c0_seq4:2341-2520(+)